MTEPEQEKAHPPTSDRGSDRASQIGSREGAGAEEVVGIYDVYVRGGRERVEGRDAVSWAVEAVGRGAGEVLLTSMDRDGTADGYDLELTRAVSDAVPVPVIASGGAGSLEHLSAAIADGAADAVLCASIFHYGEYRVRDAKRHLADAGIPVRT